MRKNHFPKNMLLSSLILTTSSLTFGTLSSSPSEVSIHSNSSLSEQNAQDSTLLEIEVVNVEATAGDRDNTPAVEVFEEEVIPYDDDSTMILVDSLLAGHKTELQQKKQKKAAERREKAAERKQNKKNKPKKTFKQQKQILEREKNNHQEGRAFFKKQKKALKLYHSRNNEHFGNQYQIAVKIANVASYLMEQHYAGKASVVAGALCLRKMQQYKNEYDKLQEVYENCTKMKIELKRQKARREIKIVESFSSDEKENLTEHFNKLFPKKKELVSFLERSFSPTMNCTLKGFSAIGAWLLGGSINGYRVTCESQLGRRVLYGLGSVGVGVGVAGMLGRTFQVYKKQENGDYTKMVYQLRNQEIRRGKVFPIVKGAVAAIVAVDASVASDTHESASLGIGAGAYMGLGLSSLFKMKEITPNFKVLFEQLDMGFME